MTGGGAAWKRASMLVTMHGGDVPPIQTTVAATPAPSASDQPTSTGKAQAAVGGEPSPTASQSQVAVVAGEQQQPAPTKSVTARHSIVGRSPPGCDPRQLQKRTEAFEQLSAFLQ